VPGWVDQTFSPEDDRAFVSSLRDLEMLIRIGWHSEAPIALTEDLVLNPEDLPEDVLDALAHPEEQLTQCAVCRRTCVRDHFVWNERRLCAWDYHATVFGKHGPWQGKAYEERYFETLPRAKYVAHGLLEDVGVDAILALDDVEETLSRSIINQVADAAWRSSITRANSHRTSSPRRRFSRRRRSSSISIYAASKSKSMPSSTGMTSSFPASSNMSSAPVFIPATRSACIRRKTSMQKWKRASSM